MKEKYRNIAYLIIFLITMILGITLIFKCNVYKITFVVDNNIFETKEIRKNNSIKSVPTSLIDSGGLKIYTTFDKKAQEKMEESILRYMDNQDELQVASVMVDPNTGAVLALTGGINYAKSQYNRALSSKRQVGSAMKPFLYYAALENGLTSSSTFTSEETTFHFANNELYSPSNYNHIYGNQDITMAAAIAYSDNVYAVKTHLFLGTDTLVNTARLTGISESLPGNPSLALGTSELNMLDFAHGYTTLASGGDEHDLYFIEKVEDMDGNVLYEHKSKHNYVLNSNDVFILNEMMTNTTNSKFSDYTTPTALSLASRMSRKYALKTGTTNYDKATQAALGYPSGATNDGVMAGYSPTISLAMWTGYVDNKKGQYLMQWQMISQRNGLYRALAKAVFDNNGAKFQKPSSVVSVKIEKNSNPPALPSPSTPANQIVTELFKRGTEPTEVSNKYNKLENVTGLQIDYTNGTVKLSWNSVNQPNDIKNKNYGPFGYRVYLNNKQLGFTTNNYYTYTGSNPYGTYMVRTSFKDMTSNMSSGTTVSLVEKKSISFEVAIDETITLAVGDSFAPSDKPIIVYENMIDVTDSASSIHSITNKITGESVESIDTSAPGSYEITYTTTYNDKSKTFTQTVNIE